MGLNLFSLFQISLDDLDNAENRIMYEFKMQPSEIDSLPFWKFISLTNFIKQMDKQREEESNAENADIKNPYSKQLKTMQKGFKQPNLKMK